MKNDSTGADASEKEKETFDKFISFSNNDRLKELILKKKNYKPHI